MCALKSIECKISFNLVCDVFPLNSIQMNALKFETQRGKFCKKHMLGQSTHIAGSSSTCISQCSPFIRRNDEIRTDHWKRQKSRNIVLIHVPVDIFDISRNDTLFVICSASHYPFGLKSDTCVALIAHP